MKLYQILKEARLSRSRYWNAAKKLLDNVHGRATSKQLEKEIWPKALPGNRHPRGINKSERFEHQPNERLEDVITEFSQEIGREPDKTRSKNNLIYEGVWFIQRKHPRRDRLMNYEIEIEDWGRPGSYGWDFRTNRGLGDVFVITVVCVQLPDEPTFDPDVPQQRSHFYIDDVGEYDPDEEDEPFLEARYAGEHPVINELKDAIEKGRSDTPGVGRFKTKFWDLETRAVKGIVKSLTAMYGEPRVGDVFNPEGNVYHWEPTVDERRYGVTIGHDDRVNPPYGIEVYYIGAPRSTPRPRGRR